MSNIIENNKTLTTDEISAREVMTERALHIKEIEDEKKLRREANEVKTQSEYEIADALASRLPKFLRNMSPFIMRLLTGGLYLACMFFSFLAGSIPTMVVLSIISGLSAGEFYYMVRQDSRLPNELIGITGAVAYIPAMFFYGLKGCAFVTFLLLLSLLIWYVFWMKAKVSDVGVSLFGALYTGGILSGFLYISTHLDSDYSQYVLIILFLSVCANDSFAYLIGSKFGKHKLAPRTSPNKSWEGFFAGIVGCCAIWACLCLIPDLQISLLSAILCGAVCAMMQVLGDLAESRIKRNSGFKDSGFILPGHGGLLDRCDSLFLASVTSVILFILTGIISFG